MLRTTCSHCSKLLGIPREAVGKKVRCAACQTAFDAVPNAEVVGPLPPPPVVTAFASSPVRSDNAIAEEPITVVPAARAATISQRRPAGPASRERPLPAQPRQGAPWGLIIGLAGGGAALLIVVIVVIVLASSPGRQDEGPHVVEAVPPVQPPPPPPPPPVPQLAMSKLTRVDGYSTAVFSPDNRHAVLLHPNGRLVLYTVPAFNVRTASNLGKEVLEAALDRRGMLYTFCAVGPRDGPIPRSPREAGDIVCYDLNAALQVINLPANLEPKRTIPLNALIQALILSPDENSLYFLDSRAQRLGRISLPEGKLDGQFVGLPPQTNTLCLTPDGKRLFACSANGALQEFEPRSCQLRRRWELNHKVADIQATDAGVVFLNGADPQWTNIWRFDTALGGAATDWVRLSTSNAIVLARDQQRLLVSFWHGSPANVTSYWVADPGPRAREAGRINLDENFSAGGRVVLSPDGRVLLCDAGYVLRLGQ